MHLPKAPAGQIHARKRLSKGQASHHVLDDQFRNAHISLNSFFSSLFSQMKDLRSPGQLLRLELSQTGRAQEVLNEAAVGQSCASNQSQFHVYKKPIHPQDHSRAVLAVCHQLPRPIFQHHKTWKFTHGRALCVCRYIENTCYSGVCPGNSLSDRHTRRMNEHSQIQGFL